MAAGNDNEKSELPWEGLAEIDRNSYIDSIIRVGASTEQDTRWDYAKRGSAYGPTVDLFAPGASTHFATNTHDESSEMDGGTSFVSYDIDNKATLIATNFTKLHHTLRRLPMSLESSRVCSVTLTIGPLPQSRWRKKSRRWLGQMRCVGVSIFATA